MKRSQRPLTRQRGFTLMEMVLALVLLGILSVGGASIIANSFMAARIFSRQQDSTAVARYAMWRMAREIQEIQYTAGTGVVNLTAWTSNPSNQIIFTKSGIGGTPTTNVNLTYTSGTQTLSLSYLPNPITNTNTTSTLATPVSALTFTFLDGSTNPATAPNNVRYVLISMTLSPSGAPAITLKNLVALRNI